MAVAPDKTSSIAETQNFSSGLPEKKASPAGYMKVYTRFPA
ncbi:MAG: hypothetical protein U0944_02600 [Candidatus Moranbacteria bacterium]|nr:hypothetical protein [Candidatus Moranbacteria bacterium]